LTFRDAACKNHSVRWFKEGGENPPRASHCKVDRTAIIPLALPGAGLRRGRNRDETEPGNLPAGDNTSFWDLSEVLRTLHTTANPAYPAKAALA